MKTELDLSGIIVIFGGTGDLTHRKLIPAIYNLQHEKMLPQGFAVVSVGRQDKTSEGYRREAREAAVKFSRFKVDNEKWGRLEERIFYQRVNFDWAEDYVKLKEFLYDIDKKNGTKANRIFYLAVAPENFKVIVKNLQSLGITDEEDGYQRVVIEKPFGRDLASAQDLNRSITEVFNEKNIYRIDHYLGKEMLQNMMVIRFANAFFEPIWNSRYIDNIQLSSSETVGVENRGGYYEKSGALRDMVQNHMLQLLTLTAMEPPVNLETESIRDEKVKILRSLQKFTPELVRKNVVRGQYGRGFFEGRELSSYREEERVNPESSTETFIALKTYVENFRWSGVPFYIRTGKRMPAKSTEVIVQFKPLPEILYFKEHGVLQPNLLVIRVQPQEGIYLQFNAKRPGTNNIIIPVAMDFCQNCHSGSNSPEAYERLIYDVMRGDPTLFTRWDELEYSWRFVDSIAEEWKNQMSKLPEYKSGSWGPVEAQELLLKENAKWWNIGEVRFERI